MKFKYISTLLLCTLFVHFSNAQSDFNISTGLQFSYPQLNLDNATIDNSLSTGFGVDLGISYRLNSHFSFHSGVGLNYFESKIKLDAYNSFENAVDISGEAFEFRYNLQNFYEEQKFTGISVPIAVQYETDGNFRFYTKIGFEAIFFVNQSFESSAENLTTTGFFPRINAVLDRPKFAGFGSFENPKFTTNNLEIENSYNAILELGIKKMFKNGNSFYAGVFAKLGLNTINATPSSNGLISFNADAPTDFLSTSILQAVDRKTNTTNQFSKARLNIFGTSIKYEFSF